MLHQTVKGLQQQNLCALQDRAERRVGICLKVGDEGHLSLMYYDSKVETQG